MIAWTWPFGTSRFTPRRIGVSSTDTWRSEIRRIGSGNFINLHVHLAVLQLDGIGLQILGRRERLHLAGADVEDRPVQRTFDLVSFDEPLRKVRVLVRADVVHAVHVSVHPNECARM